MILNPSQQADILRRYKPKKENSAELPPFHVTSERVQCFMETRKKISVLAGGNRSGKSYQNIRKAIEFAVNRPGSLIWLLTVNYKMVGSVLAPLVFKHLPADFIKEIAWSNYRLRIPDLIRMHNGTELIFKSYDSKFESLQGAAVDLVVMDEEPVDKNVFIECLARTLDKGGKMSLSFTPLHGMSCWTYQDLYLASQKPDSDIDFFTISLFDNPHIPQEEKDRVLQLYGKDEIDRRVYGLFTQLSGVVFSELRPEIHFVKRFPIPVTWRKVRAIDLGFVHPFCCLWGALSPDDTLYIYLEHFQNETLLRDHADIIQRLEVDESLYSGVFDYGMTGLIEETICDHDRQERAELEQYGVYTAPANKDVRLSIQIINRLLKPSLTADGTEQPRLYIFDDCENVKREMQGYRWNPKPLAGKEEPIKEHDDAVDPVRYLATYFFASLSENAVEIVEKSQFSAGF